jgi:hypothetical protein
VVRKATLAPFLSRSALVATVVPWEKEEMPGRVFIVWVTARSGQAGVDRTFQPRMPSPFRVTTSVKVPPMSVATLMLYPIKGPLARSLRSLEHTPVKYAAHFTGQAEITEAIISWPDFLTPVK